MNSFWIRIFLILSAVILVDLSLTGHAVESVAIYSSVIKTPHLVLEGGWILLYFAGMPMPQPWTERGG